MKLSFRKLCLAVLTAGGLGGGAAPAAKAEFLTAYSGNTAMSAGPTGATSPDADISFVVIKNSGGGLTAALDSAFGTGYTTAQFSVLSGGSFQDSAKYLYLYQVVSNSATVNGQQVGDVQQFNVGNQSLYTSAGYLAGTVFKDAQGAVGTSNRGLGTDPALGAGDTLDGKPTYQLTPADATSVGLTSSVSTQSGSGISFSTTNGTFARFLFDPQMYTGTSPILFLTSNWGPTYQEGRVVDDNTAKGDIATAVTPVPGTAVLWGVGLIGMFGFSRRLRKGQAAPAATA